MRLLIGVDLGTTGVRSIVYDEALQPLGQNYHEYPLISDSRGQIEQDAHLWWSLVKQTILAAVKDSGRPGQAVAGICVSSQGIAFVPVDGQCEPLMNAISWLDNRAVAEAQDILEQFSEQEVYRITGKRAKGVYVLPKLLWLKKHRPDIYENTSRFLMAHDFVVARLCGAYVTDYTLASGTLLFDINTRRWAEELLEPFAIDREKLPRVMAAGSVAGVLLPEVARELGLGSSVVVSVGGQDQKCAALGAGITDRIATVSLGTAAAITRKWARPRLDPDMRIPCFADILDDRWVSEGVMSTAGASLKWLRTVSFPDKSYRELDELATGAQTDNLFFFPHLAGSSSPNWYGACCGCYYGLRLNTQPGELVQALFEGIAYQIRQNLEIMQDESSPIEALRIFGGGANSRPWCQTIAHITGLPVETLSSAETAGAGAGMLAGLAAGVFRDVSDTQKLVSIARRHLPDMSEHAKGNEKYSRYCTIEKRLWEES